MSMPPGQRPGGSRPQRPPYPHPHPAQLQPGQPHPQMGRPSSRNAAFENIFGRPSAGHHLGGPMPPGGPHGRNPYPGAPSFPPQNAAQPGFPPAQQQPPPPFAAHPPPGGPPKPHGGGAPNPYSNYPAEAYRAPAQQGYDASNGGGYAHLRGPSYQSPQIQQVQAADAVPNRRTSLNPQSAQSGRQYLQRAPTQTSYNSYQSPGERLPQVSERLPHISVVPNGGSGSGGGSSVAPLNPQRTGGSVVVPMPHPRSLSGGAAGGSSGGLQPMTQASVPPRSRSLHHQTGRPQPPQHSSSDSSRIRVNIPSPTITGGGIMPFPEINASESSTSHDHDSTDFSRAMSDLSLNNGDGSVHALSGVPSESSTSLYSDSFSGLPRDRRSDNHLRAWDGNQEPQERLHDINPSRQPTASGSKMSLHRRQPSDSSIASSVYTVNGRMAPLSQIENTGLAYDTAIGSPTTPNGSENGYPTMNRVTRKSMESTHSLPLPQESPLPPGAANSVYDHRAMSFSGSGVNRRDVVNAVRSSSIKSPSGALGITLDNISNSPVKSTKSIKHSTPPIAAADIDVDAIPALLSTVAEAFRTIIKPAEMIKDGITYKDAFDGRTAVTLIARIINTDDRNLALLLGRALDAQKFFHDVAYAHRLRDTPNEVYQFKERLVAPFTQPGVNDSPSSDHLNLLRPSSTGSAAKSGNAAPSIHSTNSVFFNGATGVGGVGGGGGTPSARPSPGLDGTTPADEEGEDLPNGVFTLLTECYSPTCSPDALCYSISCPRRREQIERLNMKSVHPGLQREVESNIDDVIVKPTGTLWIHSVSQEVLDSVDEKEMKRQEAINEVMYTERDFVRHLEYLRDSWMKPLLASEVVPANRRDEFVHQVFWNVQDVLAVNHVLGERLTKRQKQQPVVQAIGDIFLECVPHFEPFVTYGAHQLFGKYEFEKEKGANPAFQKFVEETERKPESDKLELNGYLTKPTTRLGRYPLLLDAVLKYTPDDHPDKTDLPVAIEMIRAYLKRVNTETGKSENIFELAQLERQLVFRQHENIDLRLRDKNRELVHKGPMKRRGGTQGENADLIAFLFDHAFLLVKSKWVNKAEQYKVYRRPIPLELLVLITPEDHFNSARSRKLISRGTNKGKEGVHVPPKPESRHGFSITVIHLGRKGYSIQLWVDTYQSRKTWVENIEKQQQIIRDRSTIFTSETISEGYFQGLRRITCVSPYDNGNRMIYGTDEGVYFSNLRDPKLREPVKVINLVDVTQVDVIEEYQLLVVLHERSVTTFPLDCLDPNDPNAALKRGKRISSHTSFFKSGVCLGRTLVAVVKSSPLSSTIKVLEPIDQNMRGKKPQTGFMRRLNGGQESLKVFKEFYIPLESFNIHFLKTKLCVGCQKGFEIVDLETLDMQSLLDPEDSNLDFVLKRDGVRPMAIYRIEGDFLLCYNEFAFYVNKNGWRSREKWAIIWEGSPTSFALQYPYVIAFEPTFIEVRHVETGHLVQIIPGHNINCMFADMPPSTVNAPPPPRQLMYGQQQGMYGGRPGPSPLYPQTTGGYGGGYPNGSMGGHMQRAGPPAGYPGSLQGRPPMPGMPQQYMNQAPMMRPPPGAPQHNLAFRNQVIFTSDEHHVQFLKLPQRARRGSDAKSIKSMRSVRA